MSLPSLGVRYDPRFMEAHAGARILHDPKTAIVELIANSWDAGATEVEILWPDGKDTEGVSVEDNGVGMTNEEFDRRWRTLSYNRPQEQGMTVVFPEDLADGRPERRAFGRNGIGRWSGFCFGDTYFVETWKDGRLNRYKVSLGSDRPFVIERLKSDIKRDGHGTWIECSDGGHTALTPEEARSEIGMRFLTDPDFEVSVNGNPVDFSDIEDPNIKKLALPAGNGNTVELIVIDTQATDRTTKQHGIAWHVGGRLVGTCSWKGLGPDDLIDGRRVAAKRFTFIVRADFLADTDAIKRDWSGFDKDNEPYQRAASAVYEKVREYLLKVSEEDRKETLAKARARNRDALNKMGPLEREKWTKFVQRAQETCPSIKENDIVKLSEVVANLEQAKSGYALLHKLSELDPDQLDDLHKILEDWTLDMAKLVLDEIGRRLELIEELRSRILDKKTQEVQELQPLFERGLWIFGPEFETIEYTSNEGMTRIVQDLFKRREMTGSRNRPDFAILPDGTAGLYSYPRYDEDGEENGTDRLVIVELKRPGVKLGDDQKAQCWKYVKELYGRGLLRTGFSKVRCFLLGSHVDELEDSPRVEMDGSVEIRPMLFNTVLKRAESRLLKLHERVKNAPFLREHREELDAFLAQFEESDVAESLFIG
ncbi:MAG: ATP-binding protein [bacterium]